MSSGRRRQLRPSIYQSVFHLDSDFSIDQDPSRFELKLDRTLHNVRIIKVHDLTFPQMVAPFQNQIIRFTADEESYARPTHPRVAFSEVAKVAGTNLSPISATLTGNFSEPSHYTDIAYEMLRALHREPVDAIRDFVANPTAANLATHHWSLADPTSVVDPDQHNNAVENAVNVFHNSSVNSVEPLVSTAGQQAQLPAFVPRIFIQINREGKTEIYSNFILRLRPIAYDGNPAVADTNLMNIMGFDIKQNDPGTHDFLPIIRRLGDQTFGMKGFVFMGQIYPYRLTSDFPAEFQSKRYFYITTPALQLNTQDSSPDNPSHNVLCKIPITNYGTISSFTSEVFHEHHVDINALDSVLIEVKNPDGTTPDLQDVKGLSLSLRIWYDGQ